MKLVQAQDATRDGADLNIELLRQSIEVLSAIGDDAYTRPADLFDGQRIGAHVRHIVEFYERLLDGVRTGTVDYAARQRDPILETDRPAAIARLALVCSHLGSESLPEPGAGLLVRPEDSAHGPFGSTMGRELEAVASHTVHHFALIAVLLRYFGLPVPADFGVSKATLRYRAGNAREQAA